MSNLDVLHRVLLATQFDDCDGIWWRTTRVDHEHDVAEDLYAIVACSDVFEWGTNDAEPVTADNVDLLEATRREVVELLEDKYPPDWLLLFVARVREMRPQGAMYKHLDRRLWPLFDAAGPERETNAINPYPRPANPT